MIIRASDIVAQEVCETRAQIADGEIRALALRGQASLLIEQAQRIEVESTMMQKHLKVLADLEAKRFERTVRGEFYQNVDGSVTLEVA